MEHLLLSKTVLNHSIALIKPKNDRKSNKIVYVSQITKSKLTTSHRITNYKRACNECHSLQLKNNYPLIVLSPITIHQTHSNKIQNSDNNLHPINQIQCFPILDAQYLCDPFIITTKESDNIQLSLFNAMISLFKNFTNLNSLHMLCLNTHQEFKYLKFIQFKSNKNIIAFIFDNSKYHSLKISFCIQNKSFINTIYGHNDIQCIFPFYNFLSLNNQIENHSNNCNQNTNSNPYSSLNNTDYYTNFDKTNINHLLFNIICPDSRNGNLLVLDNSDLCSTQTFYENYENNNKTLIPTPWYHSGFKSFSDGINKINSKQQKLIYIINNLWFDCCDEYLPNETFPCNSFKMIYYDGTCTYFGTKRKKCINREIKPINDIGIVFKKQLLMRKSVSYFALTVSIRGYKNGQNLFTEKITNDISEIANKYKYKINDCKYVHNFKSRKMLLLVYDVYGVGNEYGIRFYGVCLLLFMVVLLIYWYN
eukprot:377266_1